MTLRAELPVHRNRTLYSRFATTLYPRAPGVLYYIFTHEQQELVVDGDGVQHDSATWAFAAPITGASSP